MAFRRADIQRPVDYQLKEHWAVQRVECEDSGSEQSHSKFSHAHIITPNEIFKIAVNHDRFTTEGFDCIL